MATLPSLPLFPGAGRATGRRLSEVLKGLRRHRRLRPPEVAARMQMRLRSYEYFEAGHGQPNLERLAAFAEAIDVDPFAILAALALDSPPFAARCADNKLMLIFMIALQDFEAEAGDDIAGLEPRVLIAAFTRMFADLQATARSRDPVVDAWLARHRHRSDETQDEGG